MPGLTLADLKLGHVPRRHRDGAYPRWIKEHSGLAAEHRDRDDQKPEGTHRRDGRRFSATVFRSVRRFNRATRWRHHLANIKRSNIGIKTIALMAKESARTESMTFSEVIFLCLPGDTKEKHFKSVFDMMDAGIADMRTYQFILLPRNRGSQ